MSFNRVNKSITLALSLVIISTPILSTVNAMENINNIKVIEINDKEKNIEEVSNYFNLNDKERFELIKNIEENKLNKIEERGKISWISKSVRKIWRRLPFKVRKIIATYTGIEAFLNAIDHFTGTVENVIYNACRKVGMNEDVSWWVTKVITLFV